VSVKVGFLCIEKSQLLGVLWMVMSRKFSFWSISCSAVNLRFGCILLKSCRMFGMFEWFESYMIRMSSTYLKYPVILCLSVRVGMWEFSRFCRKNSARRLEVGAGSHG
jgi:hypothetical protein